MEARKGEEIEGKRINRKQKGKAGIEGKRINRKQKGKAGNRGRKKERRKGRNTCGR